MKTIDLFEYDKSLGENLLGGIDEAGRGPLCGPVVCACCVMPYDEMIDGINDSKKVSEKKREELFEAIKNKAIAYSVSIVSPEEIDRINILNATKKGMAECVENIAVKPELVLIDAVKLDIPILTKSIIKGDATSYCIAAASILAKVTRDRIMRKYDKMYPEYGFAKNKGYGTKQHIEAIKKYGLCEIHRRTFVKNFI
ncbi:MAG: ribonuclease HII [Firmicutes bacterium]|nr:ribonuclease HII [Bacillota bacterium]MDY5531479.1 ribonuclease HII [Pumilibacteraceae bacterium]